MYMSIAVLTVARKRFIDYRMDMARKKKMVTMTLPHKTVECLDEFVAQQELPPARNTVVDAAIKAYLKGKGFRYE